MDRREMHTCRGELSQVGDTQDTRTVPRALKGTPRSVLTTSLSGPSSSTFYGYGSRGTESLRSSTGWTWGVIRRSSSSALFRTPEMNVKSNSTGSAKIKKTLLLVKHPSKTPLPYRWIDERLLHEKVTALITGAYEVFPLTNSY